jgi:general secretion pathway protein F
MQYLVKAVQADGSVLALSVDASSASEAGAHASRQGHAVISVAGQRMRLPVPGRQSFSILLFSQELLALLSAGLSLIEALQGLEDRESRYHAGGVVESILRALSEGQPFSAAIAQFPRHFPQLYVASIQASERTGDLAEALRRYIAYQEQMERVRKTLVSAALYPALVVGVGALVISFLLFYVVPRFSTVYESYSGDLGFFSAALIATGKAVANHGALITALAAALVTAVVAGAASAAVRARLAAFVCLIPFVADKVRLYELSRLYRTLGMLLKGGIPMMRAVRMVTSLMTQEGQARLTRAGVLISEGRAISSAFAEVRLTTSVALRMLVVGERTGDMGRMMERVAEFHEEDLSRWLERFSKLFEPVLMLAIGLAVGAIVVLMYMPIFELATAVK